MNVKVLVTGGAGYIGSHTCVQLLNAGASVVVVAGSMKAGVGADDVLLSGPARVPRRCVTTTTMPCPLPRDARHHPT